MEENMKEFCCQKALSQIKAGCSILVPRLTDEDIIKYKRKATSVDQIRPLKFRKTEDETGVVYCLVTESDSDSENEIQHIPTPPRFPTPKNISKSIRTISLLSDDEEDVVKTENNNVRVATANGPSTSAIIEEKTVGKYENDDSINPCEIIPESHSIQSESGIANRVNSENDSMVAPITPCEIIPESHSILSESGIANRVNNENDSMVASITPCKIVPESHSIQSESRIANNVNSENDSIIASISPCEILPESHSIQSESKTANNVNSKNDAPAIREKSENNDSIVASISPSEIVPEGHSIQCESRTANNVNNKNDAPTTREKSENSDSVVASISPSEIVPENHSIQSKSRTANNVNSKNDAPTIECETAEIQIAHPSTAAQPEQSSSKTVHDRDYQFISVLPSNILGIVKKNVNHSNFELATKLKDSSNTVSVIKLNKDLVSKHSRESEVKSKVTDSIPTNDGKSIEKLAPIGVNVSESDLPKYSSNCIPGIKHTFPNDTVVMKCVPPTLKITPSQTTSATVQIVGDVRIMKNYNEPATKVQIKRENSSQNVSSDATSNNTCISMPSLSPPPSSNDRVPCSKSTENLSELILIDNRSSIGNPSIEIPPPSATVMQHKIRVKGLDKLGVRSEHNENYLLRDAPKITISESVDYKLGVRSQHNEKYLLRDAPKITTSGNVDHPLLQMMARTVYPFKEEIELISTRLKMILENRLAYETKERSLSRSKLNIELQIACENHKSIERDNMKKLIPLIESCLQGGLSADIFIRKLNEVFEEKSKTVKPKQKLMKKSPLAWLIEMLRDLLYGETFPVGNILQHLPREEFHRIVTKMNPSASSSQLNAINSLLVVSNTTARKTSMVEQYETCTPTASINRLQNYNSRNDASPRTMTRDTNPVENLTSPRSSEFPMYSQRMNPQPARHPQSVMMNPQPARHSESQMNPQPARHPQSVMMNPQPARHSESQMNPQPARHPQSVMMNPQPACYSESLAMNLQPPPYSESPTTIPLRMYPQLYRRLESPTTNPLMMNSQPSSSRLNQCYVSNPVSTPVFNDQIRSSHSVNPVSTPIRRDSIPSPHYANATRCNNLPASPESASLQNQVVRGPSNTFSEPLPPMDRMLLNYGVDGRFGQNSLNTAFHSQSVHPQRMPTLHHQAQYQPRMEPSPSSNQPNPLEGITSSDWHAFWKKTLENCGVGPTPAPMQNAINPCQNYQNMFNMNRPVQTRPSMFQNNSYERNTPQRITYPNTIPSNEIFQGHQQSNLMPAISRNTPPVAVHQTTTIVQQRIFEQSPRQPPPSYNSQVNSTRFVQPTNEMPSHRSSQSVNLKPPSIPELRVDDSVQEQVVNSSISPSETQSPINLHSRSTPNRPREISQSASGLQIHRVESSSSPNFNLGQDPEGGMNNINDLFTKETDTNELEECIRGLLNEDTSS